MKRIGSILFNRVFMVALAIILQFSWIFFTLYDFSIRFTFVDFGIRVLSYIVALTVINNWSNPYYKLVCGVWTIRAYKEDTEAHGRRAPGSISVPENRR